MPEAAILVVYDDAPIRRMLDRTLSAEGYSVETAADGGQALGAVEASRPGLRVPRGVGAGPARPRRRPPWRRRVRRLAPPAGKGARGAGPHAHCARLRPRP